ncbi:YebO-like protein [Izhakiella capsodis]|uniref:YebO-like protein n=1 Tax=Izhakiella capsodis TaxID=1367852 RepID=A0A1I4ZB72_9GAMM|nr:YebO family protein [Izhakiella capsodis]SFN47542.1 YebO-like protein [Izhakiella capsodis]
MNQFLNVSSGFFSIIALAVVIVALIAWYFVNRASVKANAQIRLLEALLEEQKQQNTLLRRLTDRLVLEEEAVESTDENKDFIRLIPER